MSERLVDMVREYDGKFIVRLPAETAIYTQLKGDPGEFVLVYIEKAFDPHLKMPTQNINERAICRTATFKDNRGFDHLGLEIPHELINDYGIKAGEYIEMLIEHVVMQDRIAAVYPNLEILNQYPYWWRQIK